MTQRNIVALSFDHCVHKMDWRQRVSGILDERMPAKHRNRVPGFLVEPTEEPEEPEVSQEPEESEVIHEGMFVVYGIMKDMLVQWRETTLDTTNIKTCFNGMIGIIQLAIQ